MFTISTEHVPINLISHFEILQQEGVDVRRLFRVPATPFQEKFIRKYATPIASRMPAKARFFSTSVMKRLRNPSQRLKLRYPLDFDEDRRITGKIKALDQKPWWGKRAVICLCHDVDSAAGHNHLSVMATQDLKVGVAATYNFLTHADYVLDRQLMSDLSEAGCEIGLHGYDHDQGFAFRDQRTIECCLKESLEVLAEFDVRGYRSPALSVSENLFGALAGAGLQYDSSLQVASPFYPSVRLAYPVFLEEFGIWEMPLMVQDDNYLRDTRCSTDEILLSLTRFVEETIAINGVFVFNVHPHNMVERQGLYREMLLLLKSFDGAAIKTMGEVVAYVGDCSHHQ